jgi:tellurite resistance protein TerC
MHRVDVTITAWVALVAGLVALLLLDLFVLHRGTEEVSMHDAAWSTAGFIAISVAFGVGLGLTEGAEAAGQFFAGYLLEKSLSLDNVFVWALIFTAFAVPAAYQHRVLFYGVFGALVLRGAFVAAGAELLRRFEWVVYVFGALLLWSGIRLLRGKAEADPQSSRVFRLLRRRLPTTARYEGARLVVRSSDVPDADRPAGRPPMWGVWYATPMLAVLAVIEFTDIVFAVDSIPAIFGVTREPFLVFSATALALLGLRSMYFVLAGMRGRYASLDAGLAVILAFVGAKFLLTDVVEITVGASLAVIVGVLAVSIAVSVVQERTAGRV